MKQYRIVLDRPEVVESFAAQIKAYIEQNPGYVPLLQAVEPSGDVAYIQYGLSFAQEFFQDLTIFGMTSHCALTPDTHSAKFPVVSLLLFEKSNYLVQGYDCHNITPSEAGREFCAQLSSISDLKGIIMMSSDLTLSPQGFIDEISDRYPDVPIFGAIAGTSALSKDLSLIFLNDKIFDRGIIAVALYGKELNIEIHHDLGWKPLGRQFTITSSTPDGIVKEIDNQPAFNIYRKYLGVEANEYFFENTSAFPFVYKKDNKIIGRVALNYTNNDLQFAMNIPVGTKASLAYAKDKYLLAGTLKSANKLVDFVPEAILIYACMSRRTLMGDQLADKEFSYFDQVNDNSTWSCGFAEILYNEEGAGLLNGTFISVGLREGNAKSENKVRPIIDNDINPSTTVVPLNDRLINFLENTTADLNDNVMQLFEMASHDQLTHLFNRAAFDYWFDKKYEELDESGNMAMVMFDIDHFKKVNDIYGHDIGDEVIKGVVKSINESIPKEAIIARWGGEEFIGIMPGVTKKEAIDLAETIRKSVESTSFAPVKKVTISVGVITINKYNCLDKRNLFTLVDSALYEAKETGRNKVVFRATNSV